MPVNLLHSPEKAQSAIFYSYQRYINGFAANLEEAEASEIASEKYSFFMCLILFIL